MPKIYDVKIKQLFGDYKRAKSRIAYIESTRVCNKLEKKYLDEYDELRCYIQVVDTMLAQLSSLEQQVIEDYYIQGHDLYDISYDLNYSYDYCSIVKNTAIDDLNRIFRSTEFDSIVSQEFEKRYKKLCEEKLREGEHAND